MRGLFKVSPPIVRPPETTRTGTEPAHHLVDFGEKTGLCSAVWLFRQRQVEAGLDRVGVWPAGKTALHENGNPKRHPALL